jgi:hypothetical protein
MDCSSTDSTSPQPQPGPPMTHQNTANGAAPAAMQPTAIPGPGPPWLPHYEMPVLASGPAPPPQAGLYPQPRPDFTYQPGSWHPAPPAPLPVPLQPPQAMAPQSFASAYQQPAVGLMAGAPAARGGLGFQPGGPRLVSPGAGWQVSLEYPYTPPNEHWQPTNSIFHPPQPFRPYPSHPLSHHHFYQHTPPQDDLDRNLMQAFPSPHSVAAFSSTARDQRGHAVGSIDPAAGGKLKLTT